MTDTDLIARLRARAAIERKHAGWWREAIVFHMDESHDHDAATDAQSAAHEGGWALDLEAAADALEQTCGVGAWTRCVDVMPPHGVPVLAYYVNDCGKGRRVRATYYGPLELEQSDEDGGPGDYNEKADQYFVPAGWYETNEHEEMNWRIDGTVTHWMRLPAPPEAQP